MDTPDRVLRSRNILIDSELKPASLLVSGGKFKAIGSFAENFGLPRGALEDFGSLALISGLVDTHAHINEPGRTEWEGFQTATRAAAAGGITTVIDMPLNSIPATTSLAALREKQKSAAGQCSVDYGFWAGVIPGNTAELQPLIDAGVMGFKCFLCPSGVDEFPHVSESDLRQAMPILARNKIPLIVHAEMESPIPPGGDEVPQHYSSYLRSRPPHWEVDAIRLMIKLCRETGCQVHIVHLSASEALEDIRRARQEGLPFTAETCPHYLTFESEKIPSGATPFKCAPPIRDHANREALWAGIREGLIEFIVSDHSPCTPPLKKLEIGDFRQAWGGIAGLQFSFAAVWTEMKRRGFSVGDLSRLMSRQTARFLNLDRKKGQIAAGSDADLIVWDPDSRFVLTADQIYHRHQVTPYLGLAFFGKVSATLLRGEWIYREGNFPGPARGMEIKRGMH